MAEQKGIAAIVDKAVREPVLSLGYSIWDIEYVKEGSEWYLRITIDSEKGIDIDDCEKAYRVIDPIVTELDPIEGSYHLEVSSPGVERELRTVEHYLAMIGEKVRFRFFVPVEGAREMIAELVSVSDDGSMITVFDGSKTVSFEKKKISKANIYFDYDSISEDEE